MTTYYVGDAVRLKLELKDPDTYAASDATGVRCRAQRDGGDADELTVTVSGGTATATFTPDAAGVWRFEFWRTGDPAVVKVGAIDVAARPLGSPPV